MIAILLAVAQALPSLLSLVGLLMSAFGANEVQIQTYQDMVKKQNDEGLLSVESHDNLLAHLAAIQARMAAKAQAQARAGQK